MIILKELTDQIVTLAGKYVVETKGTLHKRYTVIDQTLLTILMILFTTF